MLNEIPGEDSNLTTEQDNKQESVVNKPEFYPQNEQKKQVATDFTFSQQQSKENKSNSKYSDEEESQSSDESDHSVKIKPIKHRKSVLKKQKWTGNTSKLATTDDDDVKRIVFYKRKGDRVSRDMDEDSHSKLSSVEIRYQK